MSIGIDNDDSRPEPGKGDGDRKDDEVELLACNAMTFDTVFEVCPWEDARKREDASDQGLMMPQAMQNRPEQPRILTEVLGQWGTCLSIRSFARSLRPLPRSWDSE